MCVSPLDELMSSWGKCNIKYVLKNKMLLKIDFKTVNTVLSQIFNHVLNKLAFESLIYLWVAKKE